MVYNLINLSIVLCTAFVANSIYVYSFINVVYWLIVLIIYVFYKIYIYYTFNQHFNIFNISSLHKSKSLNYIHKFVHYFILITNFFICFKLFLGLFYLIINPNIFWLLSDKGFIEGVRLYFWAKPCTLGTLEENKQFVFYIYKYIANFLFTNQNEKFWDTIEIFILLNTHRYWTIYVKVFTFSMIVLISIFFIYYYFFNWDIKKLIQMLKRIVLFFSHFPIKIQKLLHYSNIKKELKKQYNIENRSATLLSIIFFQILFLTVSVVFKFFMSFFDLFFYFRKKDQTNFMFVTYFICLVVLLFYFLSLIDNGLLYFISFFFFKKYIFNFLLHYVYNNKKGYFKHPYYKRDYKTNIFNKYYNVFCNVLDYYSLFLTSFYVDKDILNMLKWIEKYNLLFDNDSWSNTWSKADIWWLTILFINILLVLLVIIVLLFKFHIFNIHIFNE